MTKRQKIKRVKQLVNRYGISEEEADFYIEMSELIPVDEYGTVSGRELHEVLEIGTVYVDWMKRMIKYGFDEGYDYTITTEKVSSQKRERTYEQENHILTLDMAKHLAMIQRTPIGMEVRKYFILNEKLVKFEEGWEQERQTNRRERNRLTSSYKQSHIEQKGYEPKGYNYGNLTNSIYKIVFGMEAKELKDALGVKQKEPVPDWIHKDANEALDYVYSSLSTLLEVGVDKEEALETVQDLFDKKFGGVIEI